MDQETGTRGRACRCGQGRGDCGVVSAVDVVAGWWGGLAAPWMRLQDGGGGGVVAVDKSTGTRAKDHHRGRSHRDEGERASVMVETVGTRGRTHCCG